MRCSTVHKQWLGLTFWKSNIDPVNGQDSDSWEKWGLAFDLIIDWDASYKEYNPNFLRPSCKAYPLLRCERVYLPLCKVADTPLYIKEHEYTHVAEPTRVLVWWYLMLMNFRRRFCPTPGMLTKGAVGAGPTAPWSDVWQHWSVGWNAR